MWRDGLEAGAAAHPGRDERSGSGVESRLSQVPQKSAATLPGNYHPPRRRPVIYPTLVRLAQSFQHALPADRRAGKLRLGGRRSARGDAVTPKAPALAKIKRKKILARISKKETVGFHSQLRFRRRERAGRPALKESPIFLVNGRERHRRGHGNEHSAAQPGRNH